MSRREPSSRLLLSALCFLSLAGWARAQDGGQRFTVRIQAARIQAVGPPRAGGPVVYQGDAATDLRVDGEWVLQDETGQEQRQSFSIRAEAVVVFLHPVERGLPRAPFPVRGLYAQGFVRLEVDAGAQGRYVTEAAELYLDAGRVQALLHDATLRLRPPAGAGPSSAFVVRAERLRAEGLARMSAEQASVTVCDFGRPHAAIGVKRFDLRLDEVTAPPAAAPALGGVAGATLAAELSNPLRARLLPDRRGASGGSDALARERRRPRTLRFGGLSLLVLPPGLGLEEPARLPALPFFRWGSNWPVPSVRVGSSSRFGNLVHVGVAGELGRPRLPGVGETIVEGEASVDYLERRGTGGELGLKWDHQAPRRGEQPSWGDGFLRAYGIRDRADEDRVATPIRNEGRFWLRGLLREELWDGLRLDAEASRISDRGFLLEYFRTAAQQEKEQETYAYLRWTRDALSARIIGRWRLNDFQDQIERLPEARLDWLKLPLITDPTWGGLYLDAAFRGGYLRRRPDDATRVPSYRAGRGDFDLLLDYKGSLGPLELRAWGGARETIWSEGTRDEHTVDRFAGQSGWNLATTLWKRYRTPWGILRHEILPELGTRHVFRVTRDPSELHFFDEGVEDLLPTDHVFLRLRTRLLADVSRRRRKLLDLAVETRYFLRDRGSDVGRAWDTLFWDLRLNLVEWLSLRARVEHELNRSELVDLNVNASLRPAEGLSVRSGYRELRTEGSRALNWGASWRITPAWGIAFDQQYDFARDEFLQHRGRLVRYFHHLALEISVSHDPQQDDTGVSISIAPVWDAAQDPFLADRNDGFYPR